MRQRHRSWKPSLEGLESRQLLSISLDVAGQLSVSGTNSADQITVEDTRVILYFTGASSNNPITGSGNNLGTPVYGSAIKATLSDAKGNVLETQTFLASRVASLFIDAYSGNDVIRNKSALPADIRAGFGNDTVHGGSGRDVVRGGPDADRILGNAGPDELDGGSGNDSLAGGNQNDLLRGSIGRDSLSGGSGRDSLYGGAGNDILNGGSGADGLLGGAGKDTVTGGSGDDRFLALKDSPGLFGTVWDPDQVVDLNANDARINFQHGLGATLNDVEFYGASWTDEELQQVDQGLAILHERTGNTTLLKKSGGGEMTWYRQGVPKGDQPGALGYNGDGEITLVDAAFNAGDDLLVTTVIHEIGHNWDSENPEWEAFKALSGWKQLAFWDSRTHYLEAEDGWFYLKSRDDEFVSGYAKTNPKEDFAESFTAYFQSYSGRPWGYDLVAGADKVELIRDWLNSID